ncbi:class I SAM-dependent methyltransferase [Ottowia sp.]|uniref:class I SAM-dependent methyltransferase n=1 Tax=Ottowia sp. TaxID=1898956 RepID=UPI00260E4C72|nr:class I SAM-dependent methyltransferase [Ottowia sp.]
MKAGAGSAKILSVACGHLREVELSTHARAGDFDTFVAMDQDVESLRTLQADYGTLGIQACPASVRDLLKGRVAPILQSPPFDLIYAAGLYDYLDEEAARALTAMLFARLKPGGRLLVTNFMPDLPDSAYMEAMMDWWLIYRGDEDMRRLAPPGAAGVRLFTDPDHAIVFMDLLAAHGD